MALQPVLRTTNPQSRNGPNVQKQNTDEFSKVLGQFQSANESQAPNDERSGDELSGLQSNDTGGLIDGDETLIANNIRLRSNEEPLAGLYGTTSFTHTLAPGISLEVYESLGGIPSVIRDSIDGGDFNEEAVPYPTVMIRIKWGALAELGTIPASLQGALDTWLGQMRHAYPGTDMFNSIEDLTKSFQNQAQGRQPDKGPGDPSIVLAVNTEDAVEFAAAVARDEVDLHRWETAEVRVALSQPLPNGGLFWMNVGNSIFDGVGEKSPKANLPYPPPDNGEKPVDPPAGVPIFRIGYESPKLDILGRPVRLGFGFRADLENRPGNPTLQLSDGRVVALPEEWKGMLDRIGVFTGAGTAADAEQEGIPSLEADLTFEQFADEVAYSLTGGSVGDLNLPKLTDEQLDNLQDLKNITEDTLKAVDATFTEGPLTDTIRGVFLLKPTKTNFRYLLLDYIVNNVTASEGDTIQSEKVGLANTILGITEGDTLAGWSEDQYGIYREITASAWDAYETGIINGEQYIDVLATTIVELQEALPLAAGSSPFQVENILQSSNVNPNVAFGNPPILDDLDGQIPSVLLTKALLDKGIDPVRLSSGVLDIHNSSRGEEDVIAANANVVWESSDPRMQVSALLIKNLFGVEGTNKLWNNPDTIGYYYSDVTSLGQKIDEFSLRPGFDETRLKNLANDLLDLGLDLNFGSRQLDRAVTAERAKRQGWQRDTEKFDLVHQSFDPLFVNSLKISNTDFNLNASGDLLYGIVGNGDATIPENSATPGTDSLTNEQILARELALAIDEELSLGGAPESRIGEWAEVIAQGLQKLPGKAEEAGEVIQSGTSAYEFTQNLINGLQGEYGDINRLITRDGTIIDVPEGARLGRTDVEGQVAIIETVNGQERAMPLNPGAAQDEGKRIDVVVRGEDGTLQSGEETGNVVRGPNALRQSFSALADLASLGIFAEDLSPIGEGVAVVDEAVAGFENLGDLQDTLDAIEATGNADSIDQLRAEIDGQIAGLVSIGFDTLGLIGGDDETVSTISDLGSSGAQAYAAVKNIEAASAALRSARAGGDAAEIASASQRLGASIANAAAVGFGILGLLAGDNKTLQDIAKYGGFAASAAALALAPTPLAAVGVVFAFASLFIGGKPKKVTIAENFDVLGQGTEADVRFRREKWDYYYDIGAGDPGLTPTSLSYGFDAVTVHKSYDDGDYDGPTDRVRSTESYEEFAARDNEDENYDRLEGRYFLEVNAEFAPIFPGITEDGSLSAQTRVNTRIDHLDAGGIELTKEQYHTLRAELGDSGQLTGQAAIDLFRRFQAETNIGRKGIRFEQPGAAHGLNFLRDVNGDGVLDRIQQYNDLDEIDGPSYNNDAPFTVNFRDENGAEMRKISGDSLEGIAQAAQLEPFTLAYIASDPARIQKYKNDLDGRLVEATGDMQANAAETGISFDASSYMLANPDILETFGFDPIAATRHYIFQGVSENRVLGDFSAEALINHKAIQDDPAGVLTQYKAALPDLAPVVDAALAGNVTPEVAAEVTRSLLAQGPQLAPVIAAAIGGPSKGTAVGQPAPAPNDLGPTVTSNTELRAFDRLVSENGEYYAMFQDNGDFVVRQFGPNEATPIWASGTDDEAVGGRLTLQSDGNLVVYNRQGDAAMGCWQL